MVRQRKHRGGDSDTDPRPKMPVCKVNKNEILFLAWNAPLAFKKFYLNDDRNYAMFLFEYYHVLIIFLFANYLLHLYFKIYIVKGRAPSYKFSKYKIETVFAVVYTGFFLVYAVHSYSIKKMVFMNCKNKSKSIEGFDDLSKKKIYFDSDTIQSAHDNAFKLISNDVLVFTVSLFAVVIVYINGS
jgi:hypothetical protein